MSRVSSAKNRLGLPGLFSHLTRHMRKITLFTLLSFLAYLNAFSQVYLDSTAAVEDRVNDLLSQMTLAEKIGQMTQAERGQFSGGQVSNIATYGVGSVLSGGGSTPGTQVSDWVNMYNAFQAEALSTRLRIPLIYGIDAVHGHNNLYGATIFPHNIGLGCTRNADLVEACARITALEVVAIGMDWTFSPCVTVPRNERWGRTYEGFGEIPDIVNPLGAAAVLGYQSDSLGTPNHLVACAKHFIGDGATSGGVDQGNALISEQELRDLHLPPFREAVDQGVGTVMASFNQWNGSHCHGDRYLLTDILKTELGFEGFVISDWEGINKVPGGLDTAIARSINAGIDMAMQPVDYIDFQSRLSALVNAGVVPMSHIDDAVRRILTVKFQLGLFERPYADLSLADTVGCASHRAVARQAVRESLVLLKNDGILPLEKNGSVLVAGSRGDDIGAQCGGWSITWQGARGNITPGTSVKGAVENVLGAGNVFFTPDANLPGGDVAIVVVGEDPYAEGAGDLGPGNPRFYLSDEDQQIIDALEAQVTPMVVVILSGRPLMLEDLLDKTDAVVAAWLPGTEGDGLTDVLFGDHDFVGKLGHSWPRNEPSVPLNQGDANYDPLFPLGFGLSYSSTTIQQEEDLEVAVFPNPFAEQIRIANRSGEPLSLELYDALGRQIMARSNLSMPLVTLPVNGLPTGTYRLMVSDGQRVRTFSLLKN